MASMKPNQEWSATLGELRDSWWRQVVGLNHAYPGRPMLLNCIRSLDHVLRDLRDVEQVARTVADGEVYEEDA